MIEGYDYHLKTSVGNQTLQNATKAVCRHWPDACFQIDEDGLNDEFDVRNIKWEGLKRIFIYKNAQALKDWTYQGWPDVEDSKNDMIYLIYGLRDRELNYLSVTCDGYKGIEDILFDIQTSINIDPMGPQVAMDYRLSLYGFLISILMGFYAFLFNPDFADCAVIGLIGFTLLGYCQRIARKECIRLFISRLTLFFSFFMVF